MSYHSVIALIPLLESTGFFLVDVEEVSTHGGSIRVFAKKVSSIQDVDFNYSTNIMRMQEIEADAGLDSPYFLLNLQLRIQEIRVKSKEIITEASKTYELYGYGAPAKIVTFLSEMGLEKAPIRGVIDDNKEKQGKYLPGSGFPIISNSHFQTEIASMKNPQALIIFPWNLKAEIIEKTRKFMPPKTLAIWLLPEPDSLRF
jgi:hypothetical protein